MYTVSICVSIHIYDKTQRYTYKTEFEYARTSRFRRYRENLCSMYSENKQKKHMLQSSSRKSDEIRTTLFVEN